MPETKVSVAEMVAGIERAHKGILGDGIAGQRRRLQAARDYILTSERRIAEKDDALYAYESEVLAAGFGTIAEMVEKIAALQRENTEMRAELSIVNDWMREMASVSCEGHHRMECCSNPERKLPCVHAVARKYIALISERLAPKEAANG